MDKRNEYDPLFSELKNEIKLNPHKKRQVLKQMKTVAPFKQTPIEKKKSVTPWIVSVSMILVAASLVLLLINERPTDLTSIDQPNETTDPTLNENPPITENHTIFDVENFGIENLQLKNDILLFLDTLYLESSEVFDTVKIDANGVTLINFTDSFVDAYGNSMGTVGAGGFIRAVNNFVFSYNEVQTVYYLLDGDATAWNWWLDYVDEPITRAVYEENMYSSIVISEKNGAFYFDGITLGDSKAKVIEMLGGNYTEDEYHETDGHVLEYDNLYISLSKELLVYKISIPSFDESYYEELFDSFINDGFVYQNGEDLYDVNSGRYFYSKDSGHVVAAKYDPYKNLFLFFTYADENFMESYGVYEHVTH